MNTRNRLIGAAAIGLSAVALIAGHSYIPHFALEHAGRSVSLGIGLVAVIMVIHVVLAAVLWLRRRRAGGTGPHRENL